MDRTSPVPDPSIPQEPEFRIVPYDHPLSATLADMWNRSQVSWGGTGILETAEHVRDEHDASSNLEEFIALDKAGEAIGFCSFSKYFKDQGALYIPLLNVRPDWHGRKVGKALVLAAVRRTVELGWPRLDLFTWPGNTKAVPTYKKCGFFWERRDDTTHLMNFIPTVLSTDLLKPFFETADWYADSKRTIEVKPDGREEKGFHFFEYLWEHNGKRLRAEFERTARGLCAIETDDYLVVEEIEAHDLVAGCSYPARFRFVNKTDTPLQVSVRGAGDGIIDFACMLEADVTGEKVLEGMFHVGSLPEPQDRMRTHPAVQAEITVNGRTAVFRVGVESKPQAKVSLHVPHGEPCLGVACDCWLEVENHFPEPAVFHFSFPESPVMDFERNEIEIALAGLEKKLIPIRHTVHRYGFYDVEATGSAILASKGEIRFTTHVRHLFKGIRGRFCGEYEENWFIVNGRYSYHLQKNGGFGVLAGVSHDESVTRFRPPSLGKPWSNEFSVQRAERVEQSFQGDVAVQRAWFVSQDWPGIEVAAVVHLRANGELSRSLKVVNRSGHAAVKPLSVQDSVQHDIRRAVLPYDGSFLQIQDSDEQSVEWFDFSRMSENWIYTKGETFSRGLSWHPEAKASFAGGIAFEHDLGLLEAGAEADTPAIHLACGLYGDWREFRRHVLRKVDQNPNELPAPILDTLEIRVNDGNPFVIGKPSIDIVIREHKNADPVGSYEAHFGGLAGEPAGRCSVDAGEGPDAGNPHPARSIAFQVPVPQDGSSATLFLSVDRPDWSATFQKHLFFPQAGEIHSSQGERDGLPIYKVGNGCVELEVSPAFSHALSSLKVDGKEWLDSSFPTPGPRSWWGSWPGGIATKPWGLQHATMHATGRTAAFARLTDNRGNEWRGLSTTTCIADHPRYKGLILTQYFLLLPGIPVMAHVTRVGNRTGTFFNLEALGCECFLKPSRDIKGAWFAGSDISGNERKYRSGRVRHDIEASDRLYFGSEPSAGILQMASETRHGPHMGIANVEVTGYMKTLCVTVPDGGEALTDPIFFLCMDAPIPPADLKDLLQIRMNLPE